MQMAVVAATFANRGYRVSPRMAQESYDGDSSAAFATASARTKRVGLEQLSDDDWGKMVASMEDVAHQGGFAATARLGAILDEILNTAWRVSPVLLKLVSQGEEYDEEELEFDRKHAWFIAFAPVENPASR